MNKKEQKRQKKQNKRTKRPKKRTKKQTTKNIEQGTRTKNEAKKNKRKNKKEQRKERKRTKSNKIHKYCILHWKAHLVWQALGMPSLFGMKGVISVIVIIYTKKENYLSGSRHWISVESLFSKNELILVPWKFAWGWLTKSSMNH